MDARRHRRAAVQLARQLRQLELQRGQRGADVVMQLTRNGAPFVFPHRAPDARSVRAVAAPATRRSRRPAAASRARFSAGASRSMRDLQDEVVGARVQRSDRQFLRHFAGQHQYRQLGIELTRDLQGAERVELRQIVVGDDGVDRPLRQRRAQARLILDPLRGHVCTPSDGSRTRCASASS